MDLGRTIARASEAFRIISRHGADAASRMSLARSYGSILRSTTDATETALTLSIAGKRIPFRMRHCDIFTVAEILDEQQYALKTPLPARPVIVDAGANIGVAALWLLAHHPDATLHAFEPSSNNHRLLTANLVDQPGAKAIQAALGNHTGAATLYLAAHDAEHSLIAGDGNAGTEQVPCVRLDEYLASQGIERVDLLKLDVEGSEAEVLDGLGDALAKVTVIAGEVHEARVDATALFDRLSHAGFTLVQRRSFGGGIQTFEAARHS